MLLSNFLRKDLFDFFKNQAQYYSKIIITLLFLLTSINTTSAKTQKDTLKVLFVGNSYTHVNSLPQITSLISNDVNTKLITRESTVGGAKLSEHWLGKRGLKTKEKIKNGKFDIVVLQGNSMSAILEPDSLSKYAKLLCDFIKENGSKPYLYETWAREKIPQYQQTIDSVYTKIAKENNAVLVPVGQAWQLAKKLRPDIKLYQIDGSHPSKFGTILTATIFLGTITHEIPEKLRRGYLIRDIDNEPVLLMYFYDQETLDLIFLKKIGEEIIKKYN